MLIIFFVFFSVGSKVWADSSQDPYSILLLISGRPGAPWVIQFEESFEKKIKDLPYDFNLYREYLEVGPFEENKQFQIMRDLLIDKYEHLSFDYIVTTGSAASFFLDEIIEHFATARTIGITVSSENTDNYDTIITSKYDLINVFKEISRVAEPEKIIVVSDTGSWSLANNLSEVTETLKVIGLPYQTILDQSLGELQRSVSELVKGEIIFYIPTGKEYGGKLLYPREVVELLSSVSAVPIFSDTEVLVENGTVGGYVASVDLIVHNAVLSISASITGASSIPPFETVYRSVYDWSQLKKWDLDDKIPADSVIVNKPSGVLLYLSVLVFILISLIVSIILVIRLKHRNRPSLLTPLSEREREVARQIGKGKAIKEIAYDFKLSDRTVSTYKKRIMEKLGASDNADLLRLLIENKNKL